MTTGYQRTIGVPLGFARTGEPGAGVDYKIGSYSSVARDDFLVTTSGLSSGEAAQSMDTLGMIARALNEIDAKISSLAGQMAANDVSADDTLPDRLVPVASLLNEASVEELESLATSGSIGLGDAMDVSLIALRRAGATAEQSIVETGQLRRLLDRNANEIDAGQRRSRSMIEDLLVG